MFNYAKARRAMVDCQVRTNDVTNIELQTAMLAVPREAFVPPGKKHMAYTETEVEVAEGRVMICSRDFAKLVEAADVGPGDVVLDIACGLGYSTAVLAHMAEMVIGLEDDAQSVETATATLNDIGISNAAFVKGDLKAGASEHGPFNVIFVGAAVETIPQAWLKQLANGGRLAVIERDGAIGRAKIYVRSGDTYGDNTYFDSSASVLPGFRAEKAFVF